MEPIFSTPIFHRLLYTTRKIEESVRQTMEGITLESMIEDFETRVSVPD